MEAELTVDPKRVLLCGDLHSELAWIEKALQAAAANNCDAVLQLGDLNWRPDRPQGRAAAECIAGGDVPWVFVDGNHDHLAELAKVASTCRPKVDGFDQDPKGLWGPTEPVQLSPNCWWAARGSRWSWSGVRFGALGGAWSPGWWFRIKGEEWFPNETIRRRDLEALGSEPLDVLVCHDGPGEVATDVESRRSPAARPGDEHIGRANQCRIQLAAAHTRPKLLVHGHWHLRHSTTWKADWGNCRIEGLGSDKHPGAFATLDVPGLEVTAS